MRSAALRAGVAALCVTALAFIGAIDNVARAAAPSPAAWDLVGAVNRERYNVGLPPVAVLVNILDMADHQAQVIADDGRLSHNPALGDDVARRVAGWTRVGENVGYAGSIAAVHSALMASPPHRANILGDFNYIAVTAIERNGTYWVAQVFVKAPPGLATLTRVPVRRIEAPTNEQSSIVASQLTFAADSATAVVVARHDVFADSLAGGAIASAAAGPVLLSNRDQAGPALVAETKRVLKPDGTVYLMGGTAALGDGVERAFRDGGLQTVRIAGGNRFETAALAAPYVNPNPTLVLVTSGMSFADAMGATPVAGQQRAPIVLVDGDNVPEATLTYLAGVPAATRVAIGGTASVGAGAAALTLATERVAGNDRFETAARIAERWFGSSSALVVVAGSTFQDAAIGGPLAAKLGGPVLLTSSLPTASTYDLVQGRLRQLRNVQVVGTGDEVSPPTISLLLS